MEYYYLVLRLVHILTVAIWTGYTIMLALYILPAIQSLGPEGAKFMQAMGRTRNFPAFMSALTGLAILSGILMYVKLTGPGFMASRFGMILTTGVMTGISAFLVGTFVNNPAVRRLNRIGAEIANAGGPPTEAQQLELSKLKSKFTAGTKWIAILLLISILLMSGAKYI
jgi:hypothetical protein